MAIAFWDAFTAGLTVLYVVAGRHTMALDGWSGSMWCPRWPARDGPAAFEGTTSLWPSSRRGRQGSGRRP